MKLVFATHNINKVNEISTLLGNDFKIISLADLNFEEEIPETADTIEGNAILKANHIKNLCPFAVFADDTGLMVDALSGEPGVYSARYAGSPKNDANNIQKLLTKMNGIENRKAYFQTVLALCIDGETKTFSGIVEGNINTEPKGMYGFGYDSIFTPNGSTKTFAEMMLDEKNVYSHRAKAIKAMQEYLQNKL